MVNDISHLLGSDFIGPICYRIVYKTTDMVWPKVIPLSGILFVFFYDMILSCNCFPNFKGTYGMKVSRLLLTVFLVKLERRTKMGMKVYCWINRRRDKSRGKFKKHKMLLEATFEYFLLSAWFKSNWSFCLNLKFEIFFRLQLNLNPLRKLVCAFIFTNWINSGFFVEFWRLSS